MSTGSLTPPRRMHTLNHGAWLPAWMLRLVVVLSTTIAGLWITDALHWRVTILCLGLLGAIVPATYAFWGIPIVAAVAVLTADPDPWRTSIAVLATHIVIALGPLSLALSPGVRVVLAALRPTAVRFLWLQVAAQCAAWLTLAITTVGSGRGGASFAIVGGASFVLLAILLLQRLRTARTDAERPPSANPEA